MHLFVGLSGSLSPTHHEHFDDFWRSTTVREFVSPQRMAKALSGSEHLIFMVYASAGVPVAAAAARFDGSIKLLAMQHASDDDSFAAGRILLRAVLHVLAVNNQVTGPVATFPQRLVDRDASLRQLLHAERMDSVDTPSERSSVYKGEFDDATASYDCAITEADKSLDRIRGCAVLSSSLCMSAAPPHPAE